MHISFIRENKLTVVREIPVLWPGWESDSTWYLCKDENQNHVLVATHHDFPFIGDVKLLEERYEYYRTVMKETEHAIEVLNNE